MSVVVGTTALQCLPGAVWNHRIVRYADTPTLVRARRVVDRPTRLPGMRAVCREWRDGIDRIALVLRHRSVRSGTAPPPHVVVRRRPDYAHLVFAVDADDRAEHPFAPFVLYAAMETTLCHARTRFDDGDRFRPEHLAGHDATCPHGTLWWNHRSSSGYPQQQHVGTVLRLLGEHLSDAPRCRVRTLAVHVRGQICDPESLAHFVRVCCDVATLRSLTVEYTSSGPPVEPWLGALLRHAATHWDALRLGLWFLSGPVANRELQRAFASLSACAGAVLSSLRLRVGGVRNSVPTFLAVLRDSLSFLPLRRLALDWSGLDLHGLAMVTLPPPGGASGRHLRHVELELAHTGVDVTGVCTVVHFLQRFVRRLDPLDLNLESNDLDATLWSRLAVALALPGRRWWAVTGTVRVAGDARCGAPPSGDDDHWPRGATGRNADVAAALIGTPRRHWWPRIGAHVRVPEDPEAVLRWRYGDDWRGCRGRGTGGRDASSCYTQAKGRAWETNPVPPPPPRPSGRGTCRTGRTTFGRTSTRCCGGTRRTRRPRRLTWGNARTMPIWRSICRW